MFPFHRPDHLVIRRKVKITTAMLIAAVDMFQFHTEQSVEVRPIATHPTIPHQRMAVSVSMPVSVVDDILDPAPDLDQWVCLDRRPATV